MKKVMASVFLTGFLVACSMSGGPGKDQILNALENDYRTALQEHVDSIVSLLGEKRGKEGIASAEGTADPAEITIDPFEAEDIRELENGDFTAKAVYTVHMGKKVQFDKQERITLTRLQDKWKVIDKQPL